MERREEPLGNSFYRCFGSVFFGKEGRGFLGLGMLSGFWSSAPDLTPPLRIVTVFVIGLFGVGVLVVNCIVDASIFDLCKQY